jgi:translation initiation factor IF-3
MLRLVAKKFIAIPLLRGASPAERWVQHRSRTFQPEWPGRRCDENQHQPNREKPNRAAASLHAGRAPNSLAIQLQNIRVNGKIRAREVRVILAATGQQLGVMKTPDALRKAMEYGLDLVEVAPMAEPPVCRIVDFGKYKYEQAKHDKDKKHNAAAKMKEIKFRVNIDQHDYETKLRHAEEFLDKGNKVRVILQFRGREMAHQELGLELMQKIKADLAQMALVEQEPKMQGRTVLMTLAALPANKRKRHYYSEHDLLHMAEKGEGAAPEKTRNLPRPAEV